MSVRPFVGLLVGGSLLALAAGVLIGRGKSQAAVTTSHSHEGPTTATALGVRKAVDPTGIERDFERLYRALNAYRRVHRALPTPETFLDTSKPLVEGTQLSPEDFTVPDWSASERGSNWAKAPSCMYALHFASARPDGTMKPAFPAQAERDVWLSSDLSAMTGAIDRPDGSQEMHLSGVYVVLFSDGSIERFSHRELFFVDDVTIPGDSLAFPGMTGYTKVAYTFEELLKRSPRLRVTFEN